MDNPLLDYYRQKEIYVMLPTQGKWLKNKPNLTADGELGVRPMTISDEILLNVPDALFNGEAIYSLISSIAPDIQDPYEISMPDVDVILLASRAATYNKKMTIETRCTHCNTQSQYELDIPSVLSNVVVSNDKTVIEIDSLEIELRPNTLSSINLFNMQTVQSSNLISKLSINKDIAKQQLSEEYLQSVKEITASNISLVADAVVQVKTPDGKIVSDQSQIIEWLTNSSRDVMQKIESQKRILNKNGIPKSFNFTCESEACGKSFKGEVEFNPTFFFSNDLETPKVVKNA